MLTELLPWQVKILLLVTIIFFIAFMSIVGPVAIRMYASCLAPGESVLFTTGD